MQDRIKKQNNHNTTTETTALYESVWAALARVKELRDDHEAVVYFLSCEDMNAIKIGITRNLPQRMDELRRACAYNLDLMLVIPGDRGLERQIHSDLARYRLQREWFHAEPAVAYFIRSLASHVGMFVGPMALRLKPEPKRKQTPAELAGLTEDEWQQMKDEAVRLIQPIGERS